MCSKIRKLLQFYKNIDFSLLTSPNFTFLDTYVKKYLTYIVLNTYQNVADLNVSN